MIKYNIESYKEIKKEGKINMTKKKIEINVNWKENLDDRVLKNTFYIYSYRDKAMLDLVYLAKNKRVKLESYFYKHPFSINAINSAYFMDEQNQIPNFFWFYKIINNFYSLYHKLDDKLDGWDWHMGDFSDEQYLAQTTSHDLILVYEVLNKTSNLLDCKDLFDFDFEKEYELLLNFDTKKPKIIKKVLKDIRDIARQMYERISRWYEILFSTKKFLNHTLTLFNELYKNVYKEAEKDLFALDDNGNDVLYTEMLSKILSELSSDTSDCDYNEQFFCIGNIDVNWQLDRDFVNKKNTEGESIVLLVARSEIKKIAIKSLRINLESPDWDFNKDENFARTMNHLKNVYELGQLENSIQNWIALKFKYKPMDFWDDDWKVEIEPIPVNYRNDYLEGLKWSLSYVKDALFRQLGLEFLYDDDRKSFLKKNKMKKMLVHNEKLLPKCLKENKNDLTNNSNNSFKR